MVWKTENPIRPAKRVFNPVIARISEGRVKEDSSPKGDGNLTVFIVSGASMLRKIVPRKGTETTIPIFFNNFFIS